MFDRTIRDVQASSFDETERGQLFNEISRLQRRISELEDELITAQAEFAELQHKYDEMESEYQALIDDVDSGAVVDEWWRSELEHFDYPYPVNTNPGDITSTLESLFCQIDTYEEQIDNLNEWFNDASALINTLQLPVMHAIYNEQRFTIQNLISENNMLRAKLNGQLQLFDYEPDEISVSDLYVKMLTLVIGQEPSAIGVMALMSFVNEVLQKDFSSVVHMPDKANDIFMWLKEEH